MVVPLRRDGPRRLDGALAPAPAPDHRSLRPFGPRRSIVRPDCSHRPWVLYAVPKETHRSARRPFTSKRRGERFLGEWPVRKNNNKPPVWCLWGGGGEGDANKARQRRADQRTTSRTLAALLHCSTAPSPRAPSPAPGCGTSVHPAAGAEAARPHNEAARGDITRRITRTASREGGGEAETNAGRRLEAAWRRRNHTPPQSREPGRRESQGGGAAGRTAIEDASGRLQGSCAHLTALLASAPRGEAHAAQTNPSSSPLPHPFHQRPPVLLAHAERVEVRRIRLDHLRQARSQHAHG